MGWFGRCSEQNRILLWWALLRKLRSLCQEELCVRLLRLSDHMEGACVTLENSCCHGPSDFSHSVSSTVPGGAWPCGQRGGECLRPRPSGDTSMQGRLFSLHSGRQWFSICFASHNGRVYVRLWERVICIYTTVWMNPAQGVVPRRMIKVLSGCWLHHCMSTWQNPQCAIECTCFCIILLKSVFFLNSIFCS